MSIALNAPVQPRAYAAPTADDTASDIVAGGQPNVGLFAWTTNDLTGIKDIITYVQTALAAATRAEAAANQAENTKNHVDEVANRYESIVVKIDQQYEDMKKLAATIDVNVTEIGEYVNEAEGIRDAVKQQYDQISEWRSEILKYQMLAVYKYDEDEATETSHTVYVSDSTVQLLKLNASTTTLTINSPANEPNLCRQLTLMIQQGTGANKVKWPASVRWNNGREPVLSYDNGKIDVITLLTKDSGAKWFGFYNGGWFDA
ncbi:tail fiber protein [Cronobacter phage A24]|uniref:Tail fiber protein n=1 Tax=Cronobacter phage A24 TaxID=2795745 RepID=A0A7T5UFR6_9CAUD|nr:tail fiber protein [Cronobacter phage A24]QQG33638.1 hypothetical protein [Cronobacter phage A24]